MTLIFNYASLLKPMQEYANMKSFYSIQEFAQELSVSTDTIRRAIKNGRISAIRVGSSKKGAFRIAYSEIDRLSKVELQDIVKRLAETGDWKKM